jgi:oxalate decarboxylase
LAFPNGAYSESSTFLLSEVFARIPRVVWSANFSVPEMRSTAFRRGQLFIFEAPMPGPIESNTVASPEGTVPKSMIIRAPDQKADVLQVSTRVVDTRNCQIATEVAADIVEVAPQRRGRSHWHPNADE